MRKHLIRLFCKLVYHEIPYIKQPITDKGVTKQTELLSQSPVPHDIYLYIFIVTTLIFLFSPLCHIIVFALSKQAVTCCQLLVAHQLIFHINFSYPLHSDTLSKLFCQIHICSFCRQQNHSEQMILFQFSLIKTQYNASLCQVVYILVDFFFKLSTVAQS